MDESILRIIAFLLFAIIGYFLAKKLPEPKRGFTWIICLGILVISGYIGVNTRLIDISGFTLFLNNSLQGFVFGILSGWLMKRYLLE
jgi:surface polysaccharide O-acyltransferase-like enzyme